MVPIGKRAFMKGKLTHTNEILASLGDGYFAKYSASQAIALCNRRIACINIIYILENDLYQTLQLLHVFMSGADELLKSLETERNLYEMRQYIPLEHDVFGQDRKDIVEHWTENELDEWRGIKRICLIFLFMLCQILKLKYSFAVQHRKREKEYRQKLAKLKEKEETDVRTEEDLFKALDELEKLDDDEFYRLLSFTIKIYFR